MAHPLKVPATKTYDLRLIPTTHTRTQNQPIPTLQTSTHIVHKNNNVFKKKKSIPVQQHKIFMNGAGRW